MTYNDKLKSILRYIYLTAILLIVPVSVLYFTYLAEKHEWVYSDTIDATVHRVGSSPPPSKGSFYIVKLGNGALVTVRGSNFRYYGRGDTVKVSVYTCTNNRKHKNYRLR